MVSLTLSDRDIRAVYDARTVVHGRYLSLYGRPSELAGRSAVVAGRRVGSAVDRNRAKRRLRALLLQDTEPQPFDLVAVAKPPAVAVPYLLLRREYDGLRGRLAARVERV